jgi:hypothetical protein
MLLFGARRALLTGPHPPGSSRLCRLRGFHHWFTARYTVLPCLPDPGRLAVPTRPVVVRAAPAPPGASQAGLPSASAGLLRQPSGGSFHPTRSHNASWRTPLSAWSLAGRLRGRPGRPLARRSPGRRRPAVPAAGSRGCWRPIDRPQAGCWWRRSAGDIWILACPGRPDWRRSVPPTPGSDTDRVDGGPRPVDLPVVAEPVQQPVVQLLPYAGVLPVA